jgi:drug/metabolite transporter (DMT)-like permease
MSLIWGVPYLLIKVAVGHGVPPLTLAWARVTLGAAVLLTLAWRAGTLRTIRGRGRWLLAYAGAEISLPFPLIAAGERHVSSSLTAIVIASVPLIGAVLAMRFDHSERPTPVRAAGLAIGFGGVVALVGIDVAGRADELLGTAFILLAAVGYAIGPMLIKLRLAGLDPRATMGASLAIASLLLTPAAALDPPHAVPGLGPLAAVAFLGLVCTAVAFVIYSALISEVGTSRATVITYVNPVVAVTLGVVLLGERPGAGAIAGLLLILAGSWLSTDGRLPPGLARVVAGARTGATDQESLISRIVLITNAIANPTVQRFRLRSTSEPPPNGPAPVPTPNAPDSPASLPECISTRKISTTAISTWRAERNGTTIYDGNRLPVPSVTLIRSSARKISSASARKLLSIA